MEQKHGRRLIVGFALPGGSVKVPGWIVILFEEDLNSGRENDFVGDEREEIAEPPDLPLEPIQVLRRVRRNCDVGLGVKLVPLFVGIGAPVHSRLEIQYRVDFIDALRELFRLVVLHRATLEVFLLAVVLHREEGAGDEHVQMLRVERDLPECQFGQGGDVLVRDDVEGTVLRRRSER